MGIQLLRRLFIVVKHRMIRFPCGLQVALKTVFEPLTRCGPLLS